MFACKNCGGKVIYEIETASLRCIYCGSQFAVNAFDESTADNVQTYETNVFLCSNCGAEVSTPDNQAVSFCSYCGSQSVLYEKTQQSLKPQDIIPFRIGRKQMHDLYREKLSKVLYLPKEYTDPQYIDSMRGIYIPYYAHSVEIPAGLPLTLERTVDLSSSKYRVDTLQATIHAKNDARFYTDGSASLDDNISDTLLPYPEQWQTRFNPAYLAGFYADRSDVDPSKYIPHVREMASEETIKAVERTMGADTKVVKEGVPMQPKGYPSGLPVQCKDYRTALYPVWFLTRRDKDRVSYAIANGATGKMYVDLPVDGKKYWLVTGIIALVLFAALSFFLSMTAKSSLGYVSILTALILTVYQGQLQKVMEQETHIFDIGSASYDPEKAAKYKKKKAGNVGCGTILFIVGLVVAFFVSDEIDVTPLLAFLSACACLYQMIRVISAGSKISEKGMMIPGILSFVAVLTGWLILVMAPVSDLWYYAASLICLAGGLLPGVLMIKCYNLLASRPLPNYFARQGGINDAK